VPDDASGPRVTPARAAWRHQGLRDGFELVFLGFRADGRRAVGHSVAVEADEAWAVRYDIALGPRWQTERARVSGHSSSAGERVVTLETDGPGAWLIDGEPAPKLVGCLDVDLESSALTNAFPVNRMALEVGAAADAPAVYVRASDLSVERLEQRYVRLDDDAAGRQRYRYAAPAFEFECELVYDEWGLVLDYPGIATRAA
jgi:hypothetical protein